MTKYLTYLSNLKYIPEKQADLWTHCLERGLVTVLSSCGFDPLKFWRQDVYVGCIKRLTSASMGGLVLEITSPAFCMTSISLPADPREKIGTSLPFLNLLVEDMKMPFCFEFCIRDCSNMKRRFRMSTCQRQDKDKVSEFLCHSALELAKGWNQLIVDLQALAKFKYHSNYVEFLSLQIYANCRIRRVYFSDRRYEYHELPEEYKLEQLRDRFRPIRFGQDVP